MDKKMEIFEEVRNLLSFPWTWMQYFQRWFW